MLRRKFKTFVGKREITGKLLMVPQLSHIESAIASLVKPAQVNGIEGYGSLGASINIHEQVTGVTKTADNDPASESSQSCAEFSITVSIPLPHKSNQRQEPRLATGKYKIF